MTGHSVVPRVGVDLVRISRIEEMMVDGRAVAIARMLGPAEWVACHRAGRVDPLSVAGFLAIKEAVFKTLGSRGHPLPWTDIEVMATQGAAPAVTLHGRALALSHAGRVVSPVAVSLTHEDEYAVAVAFCMAET